MGKVKLMMSLSQDQARLGVLGSSLCSGFVAVFRCHQDKPGVVTHLEVASKVPLLLKADYHSWSGMQDIET